MHRKIKQSLFPIICTVLSAGIVAVVLTELAETNTDLPFYFYIGLFLVPFSYLTITAASVAGLIEKDGATVICIIIIPLFVAAELFILGFAIPLGIDGIG